MKKILALVMAVVMMLTILPTGGLGTVVADEPNAQYFGLMDDYSLMEANDDHPYAFEFVVGYADADETFVRDSDGDYKSENYTLGVTSTNQNVHIEYDDPASSRFYLYSAGDKIRSVSDDNSVSYNGSDVAGAMYTYVFFYTDDGSDVTGDYTFTLYKNGQAVSGCSRTKTLYDFGFEGNGNSLRFVIRKDRVDGTANNPNNGVRLFELENGDLNKSGSYIYHFEDKRTGQTYRNWEQHEYGPFYSDSKMLKSMMDNAGEVGHTYKAVYRNISQTYPTDLTWSSSKTGALSFRVTDESAWYGLSLERYEDGKWVDDDFTSLWYIAHGGEGYDSATKVFTSDELIEYHFNNAGRYRFRVRVAPDVHEARFASYGDASPALNINFGSRLSAPSGLNWTKDGNGVPVANWAAVPGARSYIVSVNTTDGTGNSYNFVNSTSVSLSDMFRDNYDSVKGKSFRFQVKAVSSDLSTKGSSLFSGESKAFGTMDQHAEAAATVVKDQEGIIANLASKATLTDAEKSTVNSAANEIKAQNSAYLQSAIQNDAETQSAIDTISKTYAKANGITSDNPSVTQNAAIAPSDANAIKVIGAELNVTSNSTVKLEVAAAGNTPSYDNNTYSKLLPFDMTLKQNGSEVGNLSVPVMIKVPVPAGMDEASLRVLHYTNGTNGIPEVIDPLFETIGGKTMATITVAHFSTFAFATVKGGDTEGSKSQAGIGTGSSDTTTPSRSSGGSSGGSGGGASNATTETQNLTNSDGSTIKVTTTTNKSTGTVTVTTVAKYTDGSKRETKKVTNKDGSGSFTQTVTSKDGATNAVSSEIAADGKVTSVKTSTASADKKSHTEAKYAASGKKLTLSAVDTTEKSVEIPASIKVDFVSYKVTKIGAKTFAGNKKVKELTVGKNVTAIGKNAFKGAKNLKTVLIKGKVTSVGKDAFKDISKKAVIKVDASKKNYKIVKNAIMKQSGVAKTVKIKRV